MTIRFSAVAVAVATAFPSFFVIAAEDKAAEAVVVTASRQPTALSRLTTETTVIYREDIERAGDGSLPQLLARYGGIEMVSNGGAGQSSGVFIRGANANHTLVLIDGVRVGSATLGTAAFDRLPLSQIERIEIVRGPASALYGADAIGGVIQIFTKREYKGLFAPELAVGKGSNGAYELSVGGGGATDRMSYNFLLGTQGTEGFSAISNPESSKYSPDHDGYWNTSFSGNLKYHVGESNSLGLNFLQSDGRNEFDSAYVYPFVSPASFNFEHERRIEAVSAVLESRLHDGWLSTVRVGNSVDDSASRVAVSRVDKYRTDQQTISWQNDVDLPVGRALIGVESLRQAIDSNNSFDRTSRTVRSGLLGWSGEISTHSWQLNLRSDRNSQYGQQLTGIAGYGYQLAPHWRATATVGTGFKSPTFNDLYYGGPGGLPNPDLKPEYSESYEAALSYRRAGSEFRVTGWRNEISNLIAWAPKPTPSDPYNWSPMNVNKAVIKGVTLVASTFFGPFDLSGNLTLQSPKNQETKKLLPRRAYYHGTVTVSYGHMDWSSGLEVRYSGRRYDDEKNKRALAAYGIANVFGEYKVSRDWTLEGRVNNLFDREASMAFTDNFDGTFSEFQVPGRSVFVGVRYSH